MKLVPLILRLTLSRGYFNTPYTGYQGPTLLRRCPLHGMLFGILSVQCDDDDDDDHAF